MKGEGTAGEKTACAKVPSSKRALSASHMCSGGTTVLRGIRSAQKMLDCSVNVPDLLSIPSHNFKKF